MDELMTYTHALLKRPYPTTRAAIEADLREFKYVLNALRPYVENVGSGVYALPVRMAYRDAQAAVDQRLQDLSA